MKQKLFQYAVIWHPNDAQLKEGQKSKILVNLDTLLANDQNAAFLAAARKIPETYSESLDQVEIAIRPF